MSASPTSSPAGKFSEVMMDDAAGAQQVAFRAEKDLAVVVKNDKSETIGGNETHTVGADMKRTVNGNQKVTIGGNDALTVAKEAKLAVAKNRALKVGGSESIDVASAGKASIGKGDSEKVGSVRLSIVGKIGMPNLRQMAQSALQGLVPQQLRQIQQGASAFNGVLRGAGNQALDSAGRALVTQGSLGAAGQAFGASVNSTAGGFLGTGGSGGFPSLAQLGQQYSLANLQTGAVTQLRGAMSGATGGLSDLVWRDKSTPRPPAAEFGLEALDKLTALFCVGGVTRGALKKLSKRVGGAYVQAAVGTIDWGSAGALTETIGGLKLTATPKTISQTVAGKLILTVVGQILRSAPAILIKAQQAIVNVGATASYLAGEALVIEGTGGVTIDALKIVVGAGAGPDGGDPPSQLELSKGGAVLKAKKLGIDAKEVFFTAPNIESLAKP